MVILIEVQIKDEEQYQYFKQFANYSSDITHVCLLRDSFAEALNKQNITEYNISNQQAEKPKLTAVGKIITIWNGTPELYFFCGNRALFDSQISGFNLPEVEFLINNNLVDVDNKFLELYSNIGARAKVEDLVMSSVNYRGTGKLSNIVESPSDKYTKYVDINETIISSVSYRQKTVIVKSSLERSDKGYYQFKVEDSNNLGTYIYIRFYSKSPLLNKIASINNEIAIASNKFYTGGDGNLITIEPIILPSTNTRLIKRRVIKPPNRKIPPMLYRASYFEYMYRRNRDKNGKTKDGQVYCI